jgi:hypothetical protein
MIFIFPDCASLDRVRVAFDLGFFCGAAAATRTRNSADARVFFSAASFEAAQNGEWRLRFCQ